MAKGQKRSNRELKKPKKAKQKGAVPAATSSAALAKSSLLGRSKK